MKRPSLNPTAAPAMPSAARPWAVREPQCANGRRVLADYLAARGLANVKTFASHHDDRLNRELSAGKFEGVVFSDLDALWQSVWKEHAQLDRWLSAGVRIEVADSPLSPEEVRAIIAATYASWSAWRVKALRRRTAACAVMCLLAVAAMAAMIWLIPPVR